MHGRDRQDDELEEFIAARTQDLHHDAYQLTAAQQPAEELVLTVLAALRRERIELAQAGSTARQRMAMICARDTTPTQDSDSSQLAAQFRPLARLSPRQRAALVLHVVDGYDERETARALRLTSRATTEALGSVPYDELPGTTPQSGELRSLLEDFGDLATSPSASTTLADVHAVPPPPRRPWWTYVAAFLVVAVTVGTVVITQRWHDDWLKTPNGLNHAHGTHFLAYTQGYKLVDIREVVPGPADEFSVRSGSAVTIGCTGLAKGIGMAVSSDLNPGTYSFGRDGCSAQQPQTPLALVSGKTLVSVNDFSRHSWPVAVYQQVPLSEYPVATGHFDVQRNLTLDGQREVTSTTGRTLVPQTKGTVLTMRGPAGRPNGTFRGTLDVPPGTVATNLNVVGLLSPTTTGRYRLRVDHRGPLTSCGSHRTVTYGTLPRSTECSLVDHRIPQIAFNVVGAQSENARTIPVEITVEDAHGPWTLQFVADRYKFDASAVDDGANG